MRNYYPGVCYFCGATVKIKQGHFERSEHGQWLTIHAACVLKRRKESDKPLELYSYLINTETKTRIQTNQGIFERIKQGSAWSSWFKLGDKPFWIQQ